jgi:hypothetical protein
MFWATLLSSIYAPVVDATREEFHVPHVTASVPLAMYLTGLCSFIFTFRPPKSNLTYSD